MNNMPQAQQNSAQAAMKIIAISFVAVLAACKSTPLPPPAPPPAPAAAPAPAPAARPAPAPAPAVSGLPQVRSMADYRRRAAQLIMQANPGTVATGKLPDQLYGIPVVSIKLNADGSIKALEFMRQSKVGPDSNDLAIQAIRRVANFGPVGNLPQPWEFNETFLYNEGRKFQLRTIVEGL
jgi:hypothetical protein